MSGRDPFAVEKAKAALAGLPVPTIPRTDRPYVYDLMDAYNAARTRDDVIWIVDGRGELRLVDDPGWSQRRAAQLLGQMESERKQWKQRTGIDRPPIAPHWQDDDYEL